MSEENKEQNEELKTSNDLMEEENEEEEHINIEYSTEDFREALKGLGGGIPVSAPAVEKAKETGKLSRTTYVRQRVAANKEREQRRQERETFLSGWAGLETAMKNNKILTAQITGVETKIEIEQVLLSVIIDKRYKASIPFRELYRDYPIDERTIEERGRNSRLNRERRFAKKFKGQTVPFCITHMELNKDDFTDHSIMCSRKKAIGILEQINYEPQRDGHTNIEEGGVYDATILTIGKQGMWVNLAGVDCHMELRNITHQYVYDLERIYKPGTPLKVLVEKITKKDSGYVAELNAKAAELESAKERSYLLDIGTETDMIITAINTKKTILFLGWLPYYEMPAIASYVPPDAVEFRTTSGDTARVQVVEFGQNGMVICRCTGLEQTTNFDR